MANDSESGETPKRHYVLHAESAHFDVVGGTAELRVAEAVMAAIGIVLPPSPTLVTQALIIPGDRTREGVLIQAVTRQFLEVIKIIIADPGTMSQIPPDRWEELIAGSYEAAGFDEVTLTPRSGDFGRDVIAVKHGFGCVRFIDQVRTCRPDKRVKANDVRALAGVLSTDLAATKAIFTTTGHFAPGIVDDPSIKPLLPFRLELVDREKLMARLAELLK